MPCDNARERWGLLVQVELSSDILLFWRCSPFNIPMSALQLVGTLHPTPPLPPPRTETVLSAPRGVSWCVRAVLLPGLPPRHFRSQFLTRWVTTPTSGELKKQRSFPTKHLYNIFYALFLILIIYWLVDRRF